MYRKLGTRGSVFGVPSGPYAGKERVIAFSRLPAAGKTRLVEALSGHGALSAILRTSPTRRSFAVIGIVALGSSLWLLFAWGWPSHQNFGFAIAYVLVALAIAALVMRRRSALTHDGTSIAKGAYLFPLDIVEANADGTLRLVPLGGVREASVAEIGGRPSLVLSFADGKTRSFPVRNVAEAEAAYAALESAQHTLEKLTYGTDLSDAVNLDPFFEVRIDDSWKDVEAQPRRLGGNSARAIALAIGALAGVGLFIGRNAWGAHERAEITRAGKEELEALTRQVEESHKRVQNENDRAAAATDLHPSKPDKRVRDAFPPDSELDAKALDERNAARERAMDAYDRVAAKPEMTLVMRSLIEHAGKTGEGLSLVFTHEFVPCAATPCVASERADGGGGTDEALTGMEDRVEGVFQSIFSETIPRFVLPVTSTVAAPSGPTLAVHTTLKNGKGGLTMIFDATLVTPDPKDKKTFRLTLPPPETPPTHVRARSIFYLGPRPSDEDLLFARGLDRLYDELFTLFFSGAPRVPLDDREADEAVRRAFVGGP